MWLFCDGLVEQAVSHHPSEKDRGGEEITSIPRVTAEDLRDRFVSILIARDDVPCGGIESDRG